MRKSPTFYAIAAALLAFAGSQHVRAEADPLDDPSVQKTLHAMNDASTWYHPDLFGEFAGMRRYAHKDYAGALKYFEIGAYYADKFSQLTIGLMHLNGEGVPKDAATAYAWLALAAERDYPDFVATRDRVKATLSREEVAHAEALRAELAGRYGDSVAKPRMEQQLRMGLAQMTGSRTGFDFGVYHGSLKQDCGGGAVIGGIELPKAGCGGADIYAKSRWEPKAYFASRDAQWRANVSVGELKESAQPPAPAEPPAQR
ncbi:MAG TPA: sel1 repeat family protein [Rudaea sp.]|nr:sel1 repeat family protein [Rudaea sp.]